jgi:hypothetical protein
VFEPAVVVEPVKDRTMAAMNVQITLQRNDSFTRADSRTSLRESAGRASGNLTIWMK